MKEIFNPLKFNQNVKNHSVIDNFLNTIQRAESTLGYGGEKKKKKKKLYTNQPPKRNTIASFKA